ncbi:MAG: hypothetical protein K0R14_1924 [Burkholderiales bacterium]|jgi:hypothetical protein|nr:hypothetical protein [Burkholderiales bacterium]
MLKVIAILCLSINMFRVYAFEEVFCYPEDISQRFNGEFFSYSHINLKDYVGDPKFAAIPDAVKRYPANQQIPTFWFKMDIVNDVMDEGKPAAAAATYGYNRHDGDFEWVPGTSISGRDKRANNGASWKFDIDYKTNKAIVTYNKRSLRLICNRSEDPSKPLQEFKFNPKDTYSLPVRFANDSILPRYVEGNPPAQAGLCYDANEYLDLTVSWSIDSNKKQNYITIEQQSNDDEEGSYPFKSAGTHNLRIIKTTALDSSRTFLSGLILGLNASEKASEKTSGDVENSDKKADAGKSSDNTTAPQITLPEVSLMAEQKKFYSNIISPAKDNLRKLLAIQGVNIYNSQNLAEILSKKLTASWMLTLTYMPGNERKIPLLCTPKLYLPWEGNTKREPLNADDKAVVMHTHNPSTTADGEYKQ